MNRVFQSGTAMLMTVAAVMSACTTELTPKGGESPVFVFNDFINENDRMVIEVDAIVGFELIAVNTGARPMSVDVFLSGQTAPLLNAKAITLPQYTGRYSVGPLAAGQYTLTAEVSTLDALQNVRTATETLDFEVCLGAPACGSAGAETGEDGVGVGD